MLKEKQWKVYPFAVKDSFGKDCVMSTRRSPGKIEVRLDVVQYS